MGYKETCKELSNRLEKDVPAELQKIRSLQRENAEVVLAGCTTKQCYNRIKILIINYYNKKGSVLFQSNSYC